MLPVGGTLQPRGPYGSYVVLAEPGAFVVAPVDGTVVDVERAGEASNLTIESASATPDRHVLRNLSTGGLPSVGAQVTAGERIGIVGGGGRVLWTVQDVSGLYLDALLFHRGRRVNVFPTPAAPRPAAPATTPAAPRPATPAPATAPPVTMPTPPTPPRATRSTPWWAIALLVAGGLYLLTERD